MNSDDIFVVDDDRLQLQLLVEHCRALGCRSVRSFRRAEEAFAALTPSGSSPSILVLDLNMPGVDGLEMLCHLQATGFGGRIVLVSGEGPRVLEAASRLASGLALNIVGVIPKPVGRSALESALRSHSAVEATPPGPPFKCSESELLEALRAHQFEAFYQPKVFVSSAALSGFEALVRWRHPSQGLLGPGSFLEAIEAGNLMTEMTRYLLRCVMRDMRSLAAIGVNVPVAVNVAISDLERPDFCNEVLALLKQQKTHPRNLHLEVTERGVSNNALASLTSMSRLKMRRVKLAVDDFGTGEASLLRLREYPFDYMKIDRRFVNGASSDSASRAIFDASMAMAFQLGLGVVAEGVETAEDWRFIRQRSCEQGQGYFIGRPMPLADVGGWLREWNSRRIGLIEYAA